MPGGFARCSIGSRAATISNSLRKLRSPGSASSRPDPTRYAALRTVSVIVPTYNCAERLVHALDSIAAQSYPHEAIEILVIDDGSTDDTAARVEEFIAHAPVETRYIAQQN